MPKARIMVVEDEADIRDLLCYTLDREGYQARGVENAEDALALMPEFSPELVLLDIMLPGMDGLSALKRVKSLDGGRIQVVLLTAKGEDGDIVKGLETGADDYVVKPFSPRVLVARIKNRLRSAMSRTPDYIEASVLQAGGFSLDAARHEFRGPEGPIELSATEFSLMEFFMSNPGWVFSRGQLIDAVRGPDYPVTDRAVDVQILGLRKKLGKYGDKVETVRGVGYRLRDAK